MWDLETGAVINILTGEAAEEQKRAAQVWRDAGTTKANLAVTCESNGVLKAVIPSTSATLGTVFIALPCTASTNTVGVSEAAKRLAFFNGSNMFTVYELHL